MNSTLQFREPCDSPCRCVTVLVFQTPTKIFIAFWIYLCIEYDYYCWIIIIIIIIINEKKKQFVAQSEEHAQNGQKQNGRTNWPVSTVYTDNYVLKIYEIFIDFQCNIQTEWH